MIKYPKTIVAWSFFQCFFHLVSAQSYVDNVWMPVNYMEDLRENKTFENKGKFCDPIEMIYAQDGELYFKTYLGRVAKAAIKSQKGDRYEIMNVQNNINRKFFPWEAYENYTFTLVNRSDTILLLIESPDGTKNDTTLFVAPLSNSLSAPITLVEGYLLLEGRYLADGMRQNTEELSFDLDGNVDSPTWKKYKLLASAVQLEDRSLGTPPRYLIQLEDHKGNIEKRVVLYDGEKKLELYKYHRNAGHRYVLDANSKITLQRM